MAKQIRVSLTCDMTGKPADETVVFAIDGQRYEIDLTSKEAEKFRALFVPYVKPARQVGKLGSSGVAANGSTSETAAIRAWARANGHDVGDRGRLHPDVLAAYATSKAAPSTPEEPSKGKGKKAA